MAANDDEEMQEVLGTGPRGLPVVVIKGFGGKDKTALMAGAACLNAILFDQIEGLTVAEFFLDENKILQGLNHFQGKFDYVLDDSNDRAGEYLRASMTSTVTRQYLETNLPTKLADVKKFVVEKEAEAAAAKAVIAEKDAAASSLKEQMEIKETAIAFLTDEKELAIAENAALKDENTALKDKLKEALAAKQDPQGVQFQRHQPRLCSDELDEAEAKILNGDDNEVFGEQVAGPRQLLMERNNDGGSLSQLTENDSQQVDLMKTAMHDISEAFTGIVLKTVDNATGKTPQKTQSTSTI